MTECGAMVRYSPTGSLLLVCRLEPDHPGAHLDTACGLAWV